MEEIELIHEARRRMAATRLELQDMDIPDRDWRLLEVDRLTKTLTDRIRYLETGHVIA